MTTVIIRGESSCAAEKWQWLYVMLLYMISLYVIVHMCIVDVSDCPPEFAQALCISAQAKLFQKRLRILRPSMEHAIAMPT